MSQRKLELLTNLELDDIAMALEAAAAEGAADTNSTIVNEIRDEYIERDRWIPAPYGRGQMNPKVWMTW